MPPSASRTLTPHAFRDEMVKQLEFDLPDFQKTYKKQKVRMFAGISLGIFGFSLGLLTFFPATMVVFFFVLYLLYLFVFGKGRKRRRRVQKDSDLRRLLIKATLNIADLPFEFLTHRYLPAYVFRESELFAFKADKYEADELVEVQAGGKFSFSHIRASEHVDAFERSTRDTKQFEGWLFRIFPPRQANPSDVSLPAGYLSRITPDQVWIAVPQDAVLYRQKLLQVEPDYDACFVLYTAIREAAAMTH
jgi:Ca2+/Na+ antiporter